MISLHAPKQLQSDPGRILKTYKNERTKHISSSFPIIFRIWCRLKTENISPASEGTHRWVSGAWDRPKSHYTSAG